MARILNRMLPVATILLVLAAWQLLTSSGVLRPEQFPTAVETLDALARLATTSEFWRSVGSTVLGWLIGLLIAGTLAVVIGCGLGLSDVAARSAASVIEIFKAIPAIAVLPLVILTLGSTLSMKVFLIVFAVFWPLVVQVVYGVRSIDPITLDTARALGLGRMRRFLSVVLPGAAPFIATGLRIGSAAGLILAVVSELVGGTPGIGRDILLAQNGGMSSYPTMYAHIITAGLLGLVLTGGFVLLERRLLHWHEARRSARANGGDA